MKKSLLIVLGAVVLVGATGAASYFLLVDKSPAEQVEQGLRSREGKEKLREEVLAEVRKVLEEQTGEAGVEQVYFTSFVMQ